LNQTEGFQNIAFFHDMGLGKTFTGSEAMIRFRTKANLIVCQKSKIRDWMNHFTVNYPDVQVFNLTLDVPRDQFLGQCLLERRTNVGIINYELAWRRRELLQLSDFTLMLDESSLIQNPKAKQTKFILKMKPAHVILLSGSPVGGKYENLWSQCHLLGYKGTQHAFDTIYVNRVKLQIGTNIFNVPDKEDPYKNVDRLKKTMRSLGADFLKTEEVMDLPEQTFIKIYSDVSKEYKRFQRKRIVEVEGCELVGDTSLTRLLYSRQLCTCYSKEKLQAFRDLIDSTHDRLIVFYNFNAELDAMVKVVPDDRPFGFVNGREKDLAPYDLCDDSITFVQYQAGSMGLNLQKANKIIYFSLPLSSEHFEQSKKRIHRIGQTKPCFYYLMLCRGSVEEQILATLEERKDFTDDLFDISV